MFRFARGLVPAARALVPAAHAWAPAMVRSVARRPMSLAAQAAQAPVGATPTQRRVVGVWLLGCAGTAFATVVAGGVTRLTESGLSIVDWSPIRGIKAPTSVEEWNEQFEMYKQTPEFKYMNSSFTLDQFKRIWYMEYFHRMMGRTVGLVFAVPAAYFWSKGWLLPKYKPAVLGLGALIGVQGLIGWLMVKSGVEHDPQGAHVPRVSQYRLALHLGTAFALYCGMLWTSMSHFRPEGVVPLGQLAGLRRFAKGMAGLIFFTAMTGAFVAGLDAGLIYNSFPKMAESWIPPEYFSMVPTWKNFFENPASVQFNHRTMGLTTGSLVALMWGLARPAPLHPGARLALNAMLAVVGAQVSLGIATLLYFVPTPLAATHQAGSLVLLSTAVWFLHELRTKIV